MPDTPRPWYRSPALWFLLPGLVFLLWAWVFSMKRVTNLDFQIGGYSVRLQNDGSTMGASWNHMTGRVPGSFTPRRFHFEVIPRPPWAKTAWFPLPSYVVDRSNSPPWRYLDLSYWLLLLVYIGLWQLPWLGRYHRRRRIDRVQAQAPADATKVKGNV